MSYPTAANSGPEYGPMPACVLLPGQVDALAAAAKRELYCTPNGGFTNGDRYLTLDALTLLHVRAIRPTAEVAYLPGITKSTACRIWTTTDLGDTLLAQARGGQG